MAPRPPSRLIFDFCRVFSNSESLKVFANLRLIRSHSKLLFVVLLFVVYLYIVCPPGRTSPCPCRRTTPCPPGRTRGDFLYGGHRSSAHSPAQHCGCAWIG